MLWVFFPTERGEEGELCWFLERDRERGEYKGRDEGVTDV
jgi:hypothetical protein